MGVSAGELRHRITIQHYLKGGRDIDGFDLGSAWTEYAKVWAKITPLSTKDLLSAQAAQSEVTARMKVRYRTDIDTTMRVIWKGRVFAVDSQGLDDNEDGMTYTTFNLSGGVETFKDTSPNIAEILALVNPNLLLQLIQKLANEDLPEAVGNADL